MTLVIKINTENAAFADDFGAEVARILRYAADRAERRMMEVSDGMKLFDVNGNCVGAFYAEPSESEYCTHCQDRPGFNGLGKTCKYCKGTGLKAGAV